MSITDVTVAEVEAAIGLPKDRWEHQCHVVSLAIVVSELFPGIDRRVARGWCRGVGGQHSWVVFGGPLGSRADCYAEGALILDATLWSYDSTAPVLYWGQQCDRHLPHGGGSIWDYGSPKPSTGPLIPLVGYADLGHDAMAFLKLCNGGADASAGLDRAAWAVLAAAPVGGWPAGELYAAMSETPGVAALVQIDKLGMTTTLNPGDCYLRPGGPPGGRRRFMGRCLEHDTEFDIDGHEPTDPDIACPTCEDEGADDPWCIEVCEVLPCPNPADCTDEHHHHGHGDHRVTVDR